MSYKSEVIRGMQLLAAQPNVLFCGQGVQVKANCLHEQLVGVPEEKRLEVPVFENTQLGMCLGMALTGILPVCLYPRLNFFVLALDAAVNHADRLFEGKPKIIIKTMTGATRPLDPGSQHSGDFGNAMELLFKFIHVSRPKKPEEVYAAYQQAVERERTTLIIEDGEAY